MKGQQSCPRWSPIHRVPHQQSFSAPRYRCSWRQWFPIAGRLYSFCQFIGYTAFCFRRLNTELIHKTVEFDFDLFGIDFCSFLGKLSGDSSAVSEKSISYISRYSSVLIMGIYYYVGVVKVNHLYGEV